jgi:small-conductance mechanosensitive channel
MFGWIEISLLSSAAVLLLLRALPYFRSYRPLFAGGGVLLLITAVFPRTGNPLGEFLFGTTGGGPRLPREIFGVVWWILGAWLFKSLLDLVLLRTFFPDNNEPHARRLFADLASGLIYVLAFFGILGTVFKEPVSTFLATSGVLAIVLGLALQNTLGDVLAGLAINIERPFGAGDWITLPDQVTGQVMQVNWRATRLRTWSHDMVVIPNSVASKAIVTNHSRPKGAHRCIIRLTVDFAVAPARVIGALKAAATGSPNIAHGTTPEAYACAFSDALVIYELAFALESFALVPGVKSEILRRVADAFQGAGIRIGIPLVADPTIQRRDLAVARSAVSN